MDKQIILDYSLEELTNKLNIEKFKVKQIYEGVYQGKAISEISNISKELKNKLLLEFYDKSIEILEVFESKTDETKKFLYKLNDNNIIEGVLLKYDYGYTICISCQVGCRMGCSFCASTLNGLIRNLTAGEILAQVLVVNNYLGGKLKDKRKITNIVMMGSGEPLDNYENVIKFLKLVNDENGINISYRNITLSTCGIADKIIKLANEELPINLTLSLHNADNEKRKEIMKVANAYSLEELISALKFYYNKTKRKLTFEYTLIKGKNDGESDITNIYNLLKGLNASVNLIPLNEVKENSMQGTSRKNAYRFMQKLIDKGINATVRRTLGEDIGGACGQLRSKYINNNI